MRNFFKVALFLIICFIILSGIIGRLQKTSSYLEVEENEISISDSTGVSHNRLWMDQNYRHDFNTSYTLSNHQANLSSAVRNNFDPPTNTYWEYKDYWGAVYEQLVRHDSSALHLLNDSLLVEGKSYALDRMNFAHMLVAFVQDIPYSYIVTKECTSENSDHPCRPNEKFGILSPVEFLYTLHGDCDTRTTLLYSLLNHFGYKTVVFISKEYAHAMLGVEIPATGDYIRHKGRKFFFWETTGTGWKPGMIPGRMNNLDYWEIALDFE